MTKITNQSLTESNPSKMLVQFILAIGLTTWVHHLYGGWVFDTLYRIIIPSITIPLFLALTFYLQFMVLNKRSTHLRIIFILVVIVFWVLSVGLIEGGYNHVLKNILHFSDLPKETLAVMFPPEFGDLSFFKLPSDIFFEGTGIIQLFLGIAILYYLQKMIKGLEPIK